jgi:uncharacterized protein
MPGGWSKRYEFIKLADTHAELEFAIPVVELQGLPEDISDSGGPLITLVRFTREQNWPLAEVRIAGAVTMTCQRCLNPMRHDIEATTRVALLASEAEADRAPGYLETFLAEDGRVSAADLVAEELLLALPLAPRHEGAAKCHAASDDEPPSDEADTRHPFADLRALMKKN